jgi:hypothetical protein
MNSSYSRYYRIALGLAIFTIVYNVVEGVVSTYLGFTDETLALFGFGLDSFIESVSGAGIAVMIGRLRAAGSSVSQLDRSSFEITALRTTGWSFYMLSGVLGISAIISAVNSHVPNTTFWGVVIGSISIVVMLMIVAGKRWVGRALDSAPIMADANCTLVCVYMSIVLLVSAALYELTGFVYADVMGTAAIVWFSVKEGRECFEKVRGKQCECD